MIAPSQPLERLERDRRQPEADRAVGLCESTQNWNDEVADDPPIRPLTREEAQALAARLPRISPWHVLLMQTAAGVVVALLSGWFTRSANTVVSALYGAAAVVAPGVLLAWGLRHRPGAAPSGYPVRFMFWEFVKLALACAMLASAVRVVHNLSWPAMLVAMVVCMKTSWLAPLVWRRSGKQVR